MTTFSSSAAKNARPALALLGLGLLAGCQTNIDAPPAATAGPLDFTSYVAVGNSLTSGYTDGGLYNDAQSTSYPALLAQQFAATGKGPASFVQPAFSSTKQAGSGYIKLQVVNGALAPVSPSAANSFLGEPVAYTGGTLPGSGMPQLEAYSGAQPDNLGVPGISVLSSLIGFPTASSTRFMSACSRPPRSPPRTTLPTSARSRPPFSPAGWVITTCWLTPPPAE